MPQRLLTFAFLMAAVALAEDLSSRVNELAELLAHEDSAVRDKAESDLEALGKPAREALQAAAKSATDPEVQVRLESVLQRLEVPEWHTDVEDAKKRASDEKKPLLLVRSQGPRAKAFDPGGGALRWHLRRAADLERELGRLFVLAWFDVRRGNAPEIPVTDALAATAEGTGDVEIFFCTPQGEVRHYLRGWWSPAVLRAEAARARAFLAADDLEEVKTLRQEARAEIERQRKAAPPHPPVRRHLPSACGSEQCVFGRYLECYDLGDALVGKAVPARQGAGK